MAFQCLTLDTDLVIGYFKELFTLTKWEVLRLFQTRLSEMYQPWSSKAPVESAAQFTKNNPCAGESHHSTHSVLVAN